MHIFGDIAWTRDRTFTTLLSIFMNLEKSVISKMFQRFKRKHNFVHIQLMFYPCVKFKKFSLSVFLDIAWTRGQLDRQTEGKTATYIPSFHGR